MEFGEYAKAARETAVYPETHKVTYPCLGLAGESGEVCEKVKKQIRDHRGDFRDRAFRDEVEREMGDVLWYLANLAADLDLDLNEIARNNLEKLRKRAVEGKLHGRGDNR
jgi:NTP pyrophosphatase (non-canonical NTP hydrolase)